MAAGEAGLLIAREEMVMRMILIIMAGLSCGCASFYSNVGHADLSRFRAAFFRDDGALIVRVWNFAPAPIYEIDHRLEANYVILAAHCRSSGHEGESVFRIAVPQSVREVYWLNPDDSRTRVEVMESR